MTIDPNSPAFPRSESPTVYSAPGLTIRVYLAAQAMQGILANAGYSYARDYDGLPLKALAHADALIAALNQPPTTPS